MNLEPHEEFALHLAARSLDLGESVADISIGAVDELLNQICAMFQDVAEENRRLKEENARLKGERNADV